MRDAVVRKDTARNLKQRLADKDNTFYLALVKTCVVETCCLFISRLSPKLIKAFYLFFLINPFFG